jgi:hypothetical protein
MRFSGYDSDPSGDKADSLLPVRSRYLEPAPSGDITEVVDPA